jgi:acyl-coenzyme A thioesterase PaaI-like protein
MAEASAFHTETATDEEIAEEAAVLGPFTDAVRALVDATIRSTVDLEEIRTAQAEIEAITERLAKEQIPGGYGVRYRKDGTGRAWGNAVIGLRNPIAPPLTISTDPSGRAAADFRLGAPYEGPPGLVHGGVISLILDQVLGHAAGAGGRPGMTGTLTIRYRQGTPLGDLRAEAWIDRAEGIKTWAKGRIIGPEGTTAEAEGLFILPRWARERIAKGEARGPSPKYFE